VAGADSFYLGNRGNNRGFLKFDLEIDKFCPKYVDFVERQGNNREFCGFPFKPQPTDYLVLFCAGFKEITGNYQGTCPR
jgi:hypothetical protein